MHSILNTAHDSHTEDQLVGVNQTGGKSDIENISLDQNLLTKS